MKNKVVLVFIGALIGLAIGYIIYGKSFGGYISIGQLFDFSGGNLGSFGRSITGINGIQEKIFLFALIGAVVGFIYGKLKK